MNEKEKIDDVEDNNKELHEEVIKVVGFNKQADNKINDYYSIEELEEEQIKTNTKDFGRDPKRTLTHHGPIIERLTQITKNKNNTSNIFMLDSARSDMNSQENGILTMNTARRRFSLVTKDQLHGFEENSSTHRFQTLSIKIPERSRQVINNTTNLNININIQNNPERNDKFEKNNEYQNLEVNSYTTPRVSTLRDRVYGNDNESSSPKSPSKWRKLSNLFKSINSLQRYETKNIGEESEIDSEMKDYKYRLYGNTVKVRKSVIGGDEDNSSRKSVFDSRMIKLINMEDDLQRNKNSKEDIYRIIVNGDEDKNNSIDQIEKILHQDPEFYKRDDKDPKYKYNAPLSNGKTLLYIACQEGKVDIVEYLLKKKFSPFVKSRLDEKEGESPIQVACRWNYINIIKVLLAKVDYKKEHIEEALKMEGITAKVKILLKSYLNTKFKSKKKCFCC